MKHFAALLVFCLGFAGVSPAQDPPELTDLRGKYLEALNTTRQNIGSKYISQLKGMLLESTQAGKLEEALAIRTAIRDLEGADEEPDTVVAEETPSSPDRPDRTGFGRPDFGRPDRTERDEGRDLSARPGSIVLQAGEATLEGALKLDQGHITNWIRPNCRARWYKPDVPAGKYDLYFVYSSYYQGGGVVQIKDFGYDFDASVERTRYGSTERKKVGTIETRGGVGMQILPKGSSETGVMNLKEIHLVPAS